MKIATTENRTGAVCADMFNSAVAASALSAAWQVGILDELAGGSQLDIAEFATAHDLHEPSLRAAMFALSGQHIVELDAGRNSVWAGSLFSDFYLAKGFFSWLTHGCGDLMSRLPMAMRNGPHREAQLARDGRAISVACRDIARTFFDPPYLDLIDGLDISTVADLGCGGGDRIVTIAQRNPHIVAIGIDLSTEALEVAREAARTAHITDRVSLVHADALSLAPRPDYADVDLITCFMMGHDFWPLAHCVRTLQRLRESFPNVQNMVLGDTCRSTGLAADELDVFSLGFEIVHATMDQYLPTIQEWDLVFEQSGWKVADRRMISLPAFSFVYLLQPDD
jgi:phenylpyruvate C(3)-methyltransferase